MFSALIYSISEKFWIEVVYGGRCLRKYRWELWTAGLPFIEVLWVGNKT
jgi:hypothetical protein